MTRKIGNGKGSISFEKARKKYRVSYTDPTGKNIVKRFDTKLEAEQWLTTTRADVFRGKYVSDTTTTVLSWVQTYIDTYCKSNIKIKTYISYVDTAKHLIPLENIKLNELTALDIQNLYNNIKNASSTKRKVHNLLKQALNQARALGILHKDIMLAVKAPSVTQKGIEIFSTEEIHKILSFAKESRYYNKYYPIILLGITTGARMGEILALKQTDIKDGYIHYCKTAIEVCGKSVLQETPKKSASNRLVAISKETENLLKSIVPNNDGFIFYNSKKQIILTSNMGTTWRRIIKAVAIPYRKFHCLRHTNASYLTANGEYNDIAARLGHSNTAITMKLYAHGIKEHDKDISLKADNLFVK